MTKMAEKQKKDNFFKRIKSYVKATKSEVKKVSWPTRKQVINNTGIVIVCILIVGIVIAALDAFFSFGFGFLTNGKVNRDVVDPTDIEVATEGDYSSDLSEIEGLINATEETVATE